MAQQLQLLTAEIDAKNKCIEDYKFRLEQLIKENRDLKEQLAQKEKDTFEVVSFLRVENDDLKQQLSNFESVVENTKEQVRLETQRVNQERDAKIKEMRVKFDEKNASRLEEIALLRHDLEQLKEFKERRAILEKELEDTKQLVIDMEASHKDAFAQIERKLFEEKQRLQREAQEQVEAIKRHSEEEVVSRLDVSTKRILQQNRRLAEDLRLHVEETQQLLKAKVKLEEENKTLKRDLELNEQSVQEFAKHSYRQSKEIKDLNQKVRSLEKSLTQIVKDFEKERDKVVARNQQETQELSVENSGLRKVLQVKDKEHKRIKKLAQEILGQRTEVEQFFLDSLEEIKDEIRNRRKRQVSTPDSVFLTQASQQQSSKSKSKLPNIYDASSPQPPSKDRVDIRDLSWEDKERVLRLLFAKINQAQMPPSKPPPQQHSFDRAESPTRSEDFEQLRRTQMTPESR